MDFMYQIGLDVLGKHPLEHTAMQPVRLEVLHDGFVQRKRVQKEELLRGFLDQLSQSERSMKQ